MSLVMLCSIRLFLFVCFCFNTRHSVRFILSLKVFILCQYKSLSRYILYFFAQINFPVSLYVNYYMAVSIFDSSLLVLGLLQEFLCLLLESSAVSVRITGG